MNGYNFRFARWYNNHQTPAVLMIDDISDGYLDIYPEPYKNDWGYLCDQEGSSYHFLKSRLLDFFPEIKITFFAPYARHAIMNENCGIPIKKFGVGERKEYTDFLRNLITNGHEIAHHGSNHGQYVNPQECKVGDNWIHEWLLFDSEDEGVKITLEGVSRFQQSASINITGGKYCGYASRENSQAIIDRCNFLYWCEYGDYRQDHQNYFGKNAVFSFPTTYAGNTFVRLSYRTGETKRDRKKLITRYFQPLYNLLGYYKLAQLYKQGKIISIQEHISPSTTWGNVQSSNIITDIESLKKIFKYLRPLDIWYATCNAIASYLYILNHITMIQNDNKLEISFNNERNLCNTILTVIADKPFILMRNGCSIASIASKNVHIANLLLQSGTNEYTIKQP